ncbi:MAG: acylphosphatase [Minisyncoccia bacterium]|jgi:acylphosphatase
MRTGKGVTIRIYGRVHGVGFRYSAASEAQKLGIVGFAENDPDGPVHIEAEGEEIALKKFLAWCRKGPLFAKVERVEAEWSEATGKFSDFSAG